jgi:hypothetical protein
VLPSKWFGVSMKRKRLAVLLVAGVAVAGAVIYWYTAGRERHELQRRRHQVTEVELACAMYADKHGGQFPRDLHDLSEIYGDGSGFPARAAAELELVAPGAHRTDDHDAVLIRERATDAKGRRMFGYVDGHFMMLGTDGRPVFPQPMEPGM